ncbi:MAG: hypothetical protein ACLFR5_04855 [Halobacteriales archaeon]
MGNALTENGPVVLVPAAWTTAGAAVAGLVETRTLLIAYGVMAVLIALFAVDSWSQMSEGVLRVWRAVLAVGLPVTVAGFVGLYSDLHTLVAISLYGWFLLPAAGFVLTARAVEEPAPYAVGAALSIVGVAVYAASVVAGSPPPTTGVALVGVGQTVGIADAVYRY